MQVKQSWLNVCFQTTSVTTTVAQEYVWDVFMPPMHCPIIVCINCFTVIREGAPTSHNRTSDVRSLAVHPYMAIFELGFPFEPSTMPLKFCDICSLTVPEQTWRSATLNMPQIHIQPGLRPRPQRRSSRCSPDLLVSWGGGYTSQFPTSLDAYTVARSWRLVPNFTISWKLATLTSVDSKRHE